MTVTSHRRHQRHRTVTAFTGEHAATSVVTHTPNTLASASPAPGGAQYGTATAKNSIAASTQQKRQRSVTAGRNTACLVRQLSMAQWQA
jgi:hypothetical protein